MIKNIIIEFNVQEHTAREIALSDMKPDMNDDVVYWVHCNLNDKASFSEMARLLNLPQSVIDLCYLEKKIPIFFDEDDTVTLLIESTLSTDPLADNFSLDSLIIHLGKQYCFTATFVEQPAVDDFFNRYQKFTRYAKTPCFILFLMLDNVINDYAKLLFNYELLTDELDAKVRTLEKNIYQTVMDVKQQIMKIKRNVISIEEMLMRASGRNISVISEQCRLSLRNASHHSHLVINEADSVREILNDLLNQIDNALMQKLNQTMKLLTGFAAIFLPLTLITGIYGMNFVWIPELAWRYGYFYALALLTGCGLVMYLTFKKKKWF